MMPPLAKYAVLNAVLAVCTTAIVTPSLTAQQHQPLATGICGGLFVSLFLRTPGALAEWYLSRRRYRWAIYVPYGLAGLLTALIALANHANPYDGDPLAGSLVGEEAVASMVGMFLLLSSILLLIASGIGLAAGLATRRRLRARGRHFQAAPVGYHGTRPAPTALPQLPPVQPIAIRPPDLKSPADHQQPAVTESSPESAAQARSM
jgi:hypothetical protein